MKQAVLTALIFSILTQSVGKLVLLSNYFINKEFITLKYCENKSKPKLHCNGKCHLKKQLKQQEKQEDSSRSISKILDEVQFCSEYDNIILAQFIFVSDSPNWKYLNRKANNESPSVFHPPTA